MKVELKNFNNDWYSPGKNPIVRILWYFINSFFLNTYFIPSSALKIFFLRLFGAKIGKSVVIQKKVNIKYPWKLVIDDYSWLGEKVWIDNLAQVTIGKNCCLSQDSLILCGNHDFKKASFDLIVKPITLKDGAWMGAKSVACNGITMGENSILTVGSIATSDLEANYIYQGNPAIKIKNRITQ